MASEPFVLVLVCCFGVAEEAPKFSPFPPISFAITSEGSTVGESCAKGTVTGQRDPPSTSALQAWLLRHMFTILLSHFCDRHGPRSILSTQLTTDSSEQYVLPDFSKESYCTSCLLVMPKAKTEPNTTTIQTEFEGDVYTTTQYSSVRFRQLNSIVRKCLSEESAVYDSRPMYFGDTSRGYSLTQSFKLRDLEARGSERRYALLVTSTDENKLLQSWETITEHFSAIINYLIERRRDYEMKSATNNEIFLRGKNIQSKSMTELLGDEEVFLKIHLWNARLLRTLEH